MPEPIGVWNAVQNVQSFFRNLFGGGGTPSSKITAPQAPVIGQTSYAFTDLDALRGKPKLTVAEAQLAKIQQLRKELLAQSGTGPNFSGLSGQASAAASLQFDPQMDAIRNLMSRATKQTRTGQKHVQGTYEDLAKSYTGDIKEARKIAAASREQEKALLADLRGNLKEDYTDSMNSLKETLSSLGIEEAGGEVMGDLAKDLATYQRVSSQESGNRQAAINELERGDIQYSQRGAPVARMAGAEGVQGLESKLQDFLFEQQGKLGQLQSQKQLSYLASLNELQQQAQSAYQRTQNDVWSKLKDLDRMEKDATTPKAYGRGLSGASNYLTDQFTNNKYDRNFGIGEASRYLGILQGLLNTGVRDSELVARAAQEARTRGISERILTRAALAYLGRG